MDVYAKALPRERVRVVFQPTHLSVIIVDASGELEYQLEVELFSTVGANQGGSEHVQGPNSLVAFKKPWPDCHLHPNPSRVHLGEVHLPWPFLHGLPHLPFKNEFGVELN